MRLLFLFARHEYDQDRIYQIDNEKGFKEGVESEGDREYLNSFPSLLLALGHMQIKHNNPCC